MARRRPAATERLVQPYVVVAEIGGRVGDPFLRRELGAQRVEHRLEIDEAAAVALTREQRCVACRLRRELQVQKTITVALQRDQRVLDILEGRQHRRLVRGVRLLELRLLRANLGEEGAAFEDRAPSC
jgi:hypothetical protein